MRLTLIDAVNGLSSLKRFGLACIPDDVDGNDFKPQFPIIAQLEEFHMYTSTDTDPIEWLLKYAQRNTNLRQIAIETIGKVTTKVESLLKLSPQLAAKFINLYSKIANPDLDNSQLAQYCSHFTSLRKIRIVQLGRRTFSERLACLSPLKQLNHLTLFLHTLDRIESPLKVESFESVQKLTIGIYGNAHKIVQFMNTFSFVHLFPKLEFVDIHIDFEEDDFVYAHEDYKSHCQSTIEPLIKCEHLREIEYNADEFKAKWTRSGQM